MGRWTECVLCIGQAFILILEFRIKKVYSYTPVRMNAPKIDNSIEYKLRVPRNLVKSYYVMKLNSPRPIKFNEITSAYLTRQTPSIGEDETSVMPSSGAGSEYGKEWKEEMKRKRKGQFRKEVSKEDLLYSLKLCGGKKDKRFEGKKEGTILENSSYYILTQCPDGVFEAVPLQAWYNFNSAIEYHTLSLDDVEREFSKRDRTL